MGVERDFELLCRQPPASGAGRGVMSSPGINLVYELREPCADLAHSEDIRKAPRRGIEPRLTDS